ncbi:MAG: flavin reductase family protein [Sulfurospirillaceae bacterium]|nr:flavin reductase family protein [Sulfurospirillaceae bacterium]
MLLDFDEKTDAYRLMRQAIIPRPIAWIVTEGKVVNIAPFSYFMALTSTPATMIVSIGNKSSGEPKDTLKNIRNTKKCTICLPRDTQLEKMHFSSKELDEQTSEAEVFDIEVEKKFEDFPSMIKGAPIAFFCELYQELDIKGSGHKPIIVEIKHMYIDDTCITNKEKMYFEYPAIARIGGDYSFLGEKIKAPLIP